jgi:hypothetical protein
MLDDGARAPPTDEGARAPPTDEGRDGAGREACGARGAAGRLMEGLRL